ncbi:hypothetical protein ACIQUL_36140 [Streptomyces sp. NPDC090303]|uniref:hypothetical protein n=1 Tax=Streptomyces sp. NPDC090303 TaxID=3365960 RepID=UPI00381D606B
MTHSHFAVYFTREGPVGLSVSLAWTPGLPEYRLTIWDGLVVCAVVEGLDEDAFDIEPEEAHLTRVMVSGLERRVGVAFTAYIIAVTADLSGEVRWTPAVTLPGSTRSTFEAACG